MNDSDARSAFNADTDHARNVVQVPLGKALCSVERVDPYYHVVFIELIRELHLSLCILRRLHPVNAFHVLKITTVAILLLPLVVSKQQFSAHMVSIKLVWLNVWSL